MAGVTMLEQGSSGYEAIEREGRRKEWWVNLKEGKGWWGGE
jgi:hypothetical protein